MMQSYQCTSSLSLGVPFSYFYSLTSGVVAILADTETITPPGATSIATVMDNSFATASLPASTSTSAAATPTGFSSVSLAPSKTYTMASPSDTHSSIAPLNSATIAAITMGIVLAVVVVLALGVWCYLRHTKSRKISSASHPYSSSPPDRSCSRKRLVDSTSRHPISDCSRPGETFDPVSEYSITHHGRPSDSIEIPEFA